jgi:hypothetical protein
MRPTTASRASVLSWGRARREALDTGWALQACAAGPAAGLRPALATLADTAPAVDAGNQRHADDGDDELDQQLEPVDPAGRGGDTHRAGEEGSDDGGDDADDDRQPDRDVLSAGQDEPARAPMMAPMTIAVMIPVMVMCFSIHVVVGGRLPACDERSALVMRRSLQHECSVGWELESHPTV